MEGRVEYSQPIRQQPGDIGRQDNNLGGFLHFSIRWLMSSCPPMDSSFSASRVGAHVSMTVLAQRS